MMINIILLMLNIYVLACITARINGNIGTRSVLFGYHTFWLHWVFVAWGWYKLYGWYRVKIHEGDHLRRAPRALREMTGREFLIVRVGYYTSLKDPRLWLAFFIHDLGYWGKPNMDGEEGETHPYWAGRVMGKLFGEPWRTFTQYHSRFLAKKDGVQPSPLCFADKMAIVHMPAWLYLPAIHATGEVWEYMKNAKLMIEQGQHPDSRAWLRDVKAWVTEKYMPTAIAIIKKGNTATLVINDSVTPVKDGGERKTATASGVWE